MSIGVFDSGMGGLTVLRALRDLLPNERFVYLGDTARLPYGTKSVETVIAYALQMAQVLVNRQIKLLVVACNTATVSALEVLAHHYPELPVIGVIEPGAHAAIQASKTKKICVISTETTAKTNIYPQKIRALDKHADVISRATGLFVALAEEGLVTGRVTEAAIVHYLSDLKSLEVDTLLLGCTHFPVLKEALQAILPRNIQLIDSALFTALAVKQILEEKNITSKSTAPNQPMEFLVTDLPERFCRVGETFLKRKIKSSEVVLI